MARGRKPIVEPTPKQMEVYELILRHVAEYGFQPTIAEVSRLLDVQTPAARGRIAHLVEKGLFSAAPHKAERSLGFVGVKFLPYQTDDDGQPVEGEYEVGEFVVTFRRKGGAR